MSRFSKSTSALPPSVRENPPPPIPFVSKVKKVDKVDGPDADKSEWIKLEFLMEHQAPNNPDSLLSSMMDAGSQRTGSSE
jgi:hypothetical protein